MFEVTDACNLKCKYCAFGEFYELDQPRENRSLQPNKAIKLIDYMAEFWSKYQPESYRPLTYIGFYGGEPLMNIDFIKQTVEYVESRNLNREFRFSMTTNALLLDRYMDYLAEKRFSVLISLDGDEYGDSYRVDHSGNNSFSRVIRNVKMLQSRHPDFFEKSVNFNSVLHNRNSVEAIHSFIKEEFGKSPKISELSTTGIRSDKAEEFSHTFKNKFESLLDSENYEQLSDELFLEEPTTSDLLLFLHQYSGNVFMSYNELFFDKEKLPRSITGTCRPFARKLFVTASGKIMQCERIDHKFFLGEVTDEGVKLDLENVARIYNGYTSKFSTQCNVCYRRESCIQCLYFIEDIDGVSPICRGFMNKENFERFRSHCLGHLAKNPHLYQKIMTKVQVN